MLCSPPNRLDLLHGPHIPQMGVPAGFVTGVWPKEKPQCVVPAEEPAGPVVSNHGGLAPPRAPNSTSQRMRSHNDTRWARGRESVESGCHHAIRRP